MLKLILLPVLALCLVIVATLAVAGCAICAFAMRSEAERTVELSAPAEGPAAFIVKTHNGSITARGAETDQYAVTATIKARAKSDERARSLIEATVVALGPDEDGMSVKIDKPKTAMNESISVHLDATLPRQAALLFETHNGGVSVADIDGDVNVLTHNGGIKAANLKGALAARTRNGGISGTDCAGASKLETHNGGITCRGALADIDAVTHNGGVDVTYAEGAGDVRRIVIETHNGGIKLKSPKGFSGEVDIRTSNGSVKTALPIILKSFDKRSITGTIGEGDGILKLNTHNGGIRVE